MIYKPKCNKLPPATVAKETALREKLEQQRAPYECRKEQKQDEIFARLSSPSDQANFDVPRFVAKYFLTGPQGQPDPKKTPNPLHLSGSLAPAAEAALQEAANSISGLHVAYTRTERRFLDDHSVVIGWGIKKVSALVRKLEAEEAEAERKREAEEEAQKGAWQEEGMEIFLQSHRDYAKRHRPPTGALKLEHLTGSYIVECARLGDYSSRYGHSMSLDIHAPSSSLGCEAAFNFAMVEGTMLLGLSEDSVEQFREETEEAGKWSEDEWKDPADDDEEEDEEATYGNPGSSAAVAKRKATGQPTSSKPTIIKRRLGETPRPNRVYFQWRGRETGLREIQCGRLGNHVGHLDFSSSGLTAHGVFVHPNFFGDERVEFKIYKADEKPHSEPEAWSDMSERGWDYERVGRWH